MYKERLFYFPSDWVSVGKKQKYKLDMGLFGK